MILRRLETIYRIESYLHTQSIMDISDIQYLIELLESSIHNQEWDSVQEAIDVLRENIDQSPSEEED